MANFVSAREIEAAKALKKQEKREARELILKHAKADHDRWTKRKNDREDDWMAPGIVDRFDTKDSSSRKRKKHKNKDKKKHSKHVKHIKSQSSSDFSSEGSEGDTWVEKRQDQTSASKAVHTTSSAKLQQEGVLDRDSWMTTPMAPSEKSLFAIEKRKQDEDEKLKSNQAAKGSPFDAPGQHPRELNPYWKQGGTGLPQENSSQDSRTQRAGDGGRNWMLRSYKRALEQAEREDKQLEEVAIERWGSLEKLHSLLRAAGIDPSNPDKALSSRKRENLYAEPPTRPFSAKRVSHHSNDHVSGNSVKRDQGFLIPGQSAESHSILDSGSKLHRKESSSNWHKQLARQEKEHVKSLTNHTCLEQAVLTSADTPNENAQNREPEVTDAQLNALSAKVMKAEMLGDSKKVDTLTKKLERLRELKSHQKSTMFKSEGSSATEEKAIPLVSTDRFGRLRPMDIPREESRQKNHPPPPKKGKRKKYTDDGEGYSIRDLVEQERKTSAKDTQLAIAGMASKFVPSSSTDDTIDETRASKIAVSFDSQSNSKEMVRAMAESRKLAETMEACKLCFGNDNFSKSLLVAVGINVYLAVPATQSLCEGHCLLIPMEHHTSMILLDENVWDEIRVFQKGLTRMFSDRGSDVVFTESYTSTAKRSHAYLECIPLPKEQGDVAPMYFKKAIMESDEEWSMNRKIIDTKKKGVKNSLPVGLPYFFVEFGLDGGYAHIIENQDMFPSHFAKEVIGGMLDLEPRYWLKPRHDSFATQKSKVLNLSEWWKPYDWTQKLTQS